MEKLNKDELFTLALHLDLPNLLNLCQSNRNINNILCLRNEIWIYKDFPDFRKLNIYDLYNLKELNLSDNKLTDIPKEIGNLTNLQVLNLNGNELTDIPKEIGGLINLQELYLSDNRLTSIPKEIGNLTNLKKLYLRNNKLTNLQELSLIDANAKRDWRFNKFTNTLLV